MLDALEQALYDRPLKGTVLVHYSGLRDAGSFDTLPRVARRGWDCLSVGSRGDTCDNALAESVIGLYKTEVILSMATENRTFVATENCTLLGRTCLGAQLH